MMQPLDLTALGWSRVWQETLAGVGVLAASIRARFRLADISFYPSFAVLVTSYTAGTITNVHLRCGFHAASADISPQGIDFGAFGALNVFEFRTPVIDTAAAAPGVVGNPAAIWPPFWTIKITTPAGPTTLRYEVFAACLYSPH